MEISYRLARPFWRSRMAMDVRKGTAKEKAARQDAIRLVAFDMAAELAHTVPGFDSTAFLAACGYDAGERAAIAAATGTPAEGPATPISGKESA